MDHSIRRRGKKPAATIVSLRIGVNPLSWSNDDMPELGADIPLERCLAESAQAGYEGIELGHKFPRDASKLKQLLRPHRPDLISGLYGSRLLERSVPDEIVLLSPHLELLRDMGCDVVVFAEVTSCIHSKRDSHQSERPRLEDEKWPAFGKKLTAIGDHMNDLGMQLAYHHHMGTVVQSDRDIDLLMDHTGPSVGLLLDTGHLEYAGGDLLAVIERHGDRINHVHCKDVRADVLKQAQDSDCSFLDAVLQGVFTVPEDGVINYRSILTALRAVNYSGWLVVEAEQDPALAHPLTYARSGYQHLNTIVRGSEHCQA